MRTNLSLTDFRKLAGGVADGYAHNAPEGDYRACYRKRVERLLAGRSGSERVVGVLPPHVHRDWHKPGALIEIDPAENEAVKGRIVRATVAAFANGVLDKVRLEGVGPVTMLDTSDLKTGTGGRRPILKTHDDWSIVKSLRDHGEVLAELEESWGQRLNEGKTGIETEQQLADLTERILALALPHDEATARRETASDFLVRLFGLKRELIDLQRPAATPSARTEQTSAEIRTAAEEALRRIAAAKMAEVETLNQLRALTIKAINEAAQAS